MKVGLSSGRIGPSVRPSLSPEAARRIAVAARNLLATHTDAVLDAIVAHAEGGEEDAIAARFAVLLLDECPCRSTVIRVLDQVIAAQSATVRA